MRDVPHQASSHNIIKGYRFRLPPFDITAKSPNTCFFRAEPPRTYASTREQPPRTVQRSDSLVDRALDMSWSTYNAEAEVPRHRAQLGGGMAAVSEGGSRRQDSEELDNGPAANLDAPAAPPSLPNGMTVADVEAMLVELRTVAALEVQVLSATKVPPPQAVARLLR